MAIHSKRATLIRSRTRKNLDEFLQRSGHVVKIKLKGSTEKEEDISVLFFQRYDCFCKM